MLCGCVVCVCVCCFHFLLTGEATGKQVNVKWTVCVVVVVVDVFIVVVDVVIVARVVWFECVCRLSAMRPSISKLINECAATVHALD